MIRQKVRLLRFTLAAASVLGILFSSSGLLAGARPTSAAHTVVIDSMRFEPATLTVNVGDEVVWFNHDPFPHTVTAQDNQFDSREIAAGRSWHYIARAAGVFPYACALHPTMLAELRVE
jgi:plastocyanin